MQLQTVIIVRLWIWVIGYW